jgi:hypothetical protein
MKLKRIDKWIDFSIAFVVWGVVEFVMVKVVSVFADIFTQFGGKLPAPTRIILRFNGLPGSMVIPVMLAGLVVFQVWRMVSIPPPLPGEQPMPWDSKFVLAVILFGVFAFLFAVVSLYLPVVFMSEESSGEG